MRLCFKVGFGNWYFPALLNLPNGRECDQFENHPQVRSSARGCSRRTVKWNKAASHAVWRDIHCVRQHFPDADQYKSLLIFNIRHIRHYYESPHRKSGLPGEAADR